MPYPCTNDNKKRHAMQHVAPTGEKKTKNGPPSNCNNAAGLCWTDPAGKKNKRLSVRIAPYKRQCIRRPNQWGGGVDYPAAC